MKVRVSRGMMPTQIGSLSQDGLELTPYTDDVGFCVYDIRLVLNQEINLETAFGENHNHIYYCHWGCGILTFEDESYEQVQKHGLIAFGGKQKAHFVSSCADTRLLAIYVPDGGNKPVEPLYRYREAVIGTERDVFWGNGQSRRFLLERDGFNIAVCNTIINPNTVSPFHYAHTVECCYYIRGLGKYTWGGEKGHQDINHPVADGEGTMLVMDKQDTHNICGGPEEMECISIFYPPLTGKESFIGGSCTY